MGVVVRLSVALFKVLPAFRTRALVTLRDVAVDVSHDVDVRNRPFQMYRLPFSSWPTGTHNTQINLLTCGRLYDVYRACTVVFI